MSNGLRNAQVVSIRFPNFALSPGLPKLIKAEKLSSGFGQAAFLSYLLLPRVPPGTRKADCSDLTTEFSPHASEILAGVRRVLGADLLIAKFPRRENSKRGRIPRRPCLRDESSCWRLSFVLCARCGIRSTRRPVFADSSPPAWRLLSFVEN